MSHAIEQQHHDRESLVEMGDQPVVLNLGCGQDDRGIGVDIHYNPDIEADLNDGIPVADDSVDRIIASHVLEHLENPSLFFRECRRVLRDTGELEIEVPNVSWLPVRLWISQDLQRFWSHKDPDRNGHWLARRLGHSDERRTAHKTLWTKQLLAEYLDRHGFVYDIDGWHGSRNLHVTARLAPDEPGGRTLHELERQSGLDLASQDYWAQTRARILSKWVREANPQRVLDAGCGSGYLTELIAEQTDADVLGIDIAEESVDLAQQRETTAEFRVGDVTAIEPASGYDVILFADVLEHFEKPERVLAQAREALAPGGHIYVSLPAHEWLWGPHDEHNDHHRRYTKSSLASVAHASGLSVERARYTNAIPLVPYWAYQRLLERSVPDAARGGHNRILEAAKRVCINLETKISPPVGVTLIADLSPQP